MAVQQEEMPEIAEWRRKIEGLHEQIRGWVAEMEQTPSVEVQPIILNEKKSGEYEVPQLLVKRGEDEFLVRPIARWVVAADGRVDMEGGEGPFILVRIVEKGSIVLSSDGTWNKAEDKDGWFWPEEEPPWGTRPLTGDLFRALAELCLR